MGAEETTTVVSPQFFLIKRVHLTAYCVRCLGHVVNLANTDVMKHITNISAVETATSIWEWDPTVTENRTKRGSLDAIAAVRTLIVKVHDFIRIILS